MVSKAAARKILDIYARAWVNQDIPLILSIFTKEGTYWGKGYRELEKGFKKELQGAKRIIVADMLGSSSPAEVTDPTLRIACFPVKDPRTFARARMASVSGKEWLPVYHTRGDTTALLKPGFLEEGLDFVLSLAGK